MSNIRKRIALLMTSAMLIPSGAYLLTPITANAETAQELRTQQNELKQELANLQNDLDKAADAYDNALTEQKDAENKLNETQDRITDLESQISDRKGDVNERIVETYRNGDSSRMLGTLLGSTTLSDLVTKWNTITELNAKDTEKINELSGMETQLESEKEQETEEKNVAESKTKEAEQIKNDAQGKVDEYQKKLDTVNEDLREKLMQSADALASSGVSSDSSAVAGSASSIPTNGGVVDYAKSRLGCPYVFGASGPNSFDCSGLVMWCYGKTGKSLPHNSESLKRSAKAIIPVSEAQPGDVVYRPGHVGIYVGNGKVIHSPHTGDVVRYTNASGFSCALRF